MDVEVIQSKPLTVQMGKTETVRLVAQGGTETRPEEWDKYK